MSEETATVEATEVEIKKEGHTHKGNACKVGDRIQVTPRQAEWLKQLGII